MFGLDTALRLAAKVGLFTSVLFSFGFLSNKLLGMIPSLNLTGCGGHAMLLFGFIPAIKLYVSIISYGFISKFTLSLASRVLD